MITLIHFYLKKKSFIIRATIFYYVRLQFFKNFGESLLSLLVIQNTYLFAKPEITKAQRKFIIQDEK